MIKKTIRNFARKIVGLSEYEYQIQKLRHELDNAYDLLDHLYDITEIKPANGNLRKLQMGDTLLLQILDRICKQYGIVYWIDYGTLLGAVRNEGFIPWDDDTDVAMLREDYIKSEKILPKVLTKFGIEVTMHGDERIGIGYKHNVTGLWIDIFPVDYINIQNDDIQSAKKSAKEYYFAFHNQYPNKVDKSQFLPVNDNVNTESEYLIWCPEFHEIGEIRKKDIVFPLTTIKFEDATFPAPHSVKEYLKVYYGENYMKFPHSGVEHHGGNCKLSDRAEKNKIDMDNILGDLKGILAQVKNATIRRNEINY